MAMMAAARCTNVVFASTKPQLTKRTSLVSQPFSSTAKLTHDSILTNIATASNDHGQQCFLCLHQAGIDIDNPRLTTMKLKWKIHDFCNTQSPNLYDLLVLFLAWLKASSEPENVTRLAGIPAISTFADQWSSTSGMNVPTTTPPLVSRPSQTGMETKIGHDAIPTEYLQQLPSNWPYTAYGIARKAGATTSFPLTNPENAEETVAWIYHEIRWNPRPLYTPPTKRNVPMYQPLLEGWTPSFLDVGTSTQKATSAVVVAASSSSEVVPLSNTITPTPELSFTSITQSSDVPIRPTRSQDPVLPKAPDATDKPMENLAHGTDTMVIMLTSDRAATRVPPLEEIWDEVVSVMVSLDSV
jgi:hypothetical protein